MTIVNGTMKLNKGIKTPWRVELHFEKYDRGEWLLQAKKTYADVCPILRDKLGPVAFFTKGFPPCPIAAGVNFSNFKIIFKILFFSLMQFLMKFQLHHLNCFCKQFHHNLLEDIEFYITQK